MYKPTPQGHQEPQALQGQGNSVCLNPYPEKETNTWATNKTSYWELAVMNMWQRKKLNETCQVENRRTFSSDWSNFENFVSFVHGVWFFFSFHALSSFPVNTVMNECTNILFGLIPRYNVHFIAVLLCVHLLHRFSFTSVLCIFSFKLTTKNLLAYDAGIQFIASF